MILAHCGLREMKAFMQHEWYRHDRKIKLIMAGQIRYLFR
jgi:hypothetical protein